MERARIDGNSFTFVNIELFDGLNEIWVKGSQGGVEVGDRQYIEVNNLPVITSVTFKDVDLRLDNKITTHEINDEIYLKGGIINADSIVAKVGSKKTEYIGSVLNNGTYIIPKIKLERGTNTIELIASNLTKTYPIQFNVVYDYGQPYVEGEIVVNSSGDKSALQDPTQFSTNDLTVNGVIHNFQNASFNDVLDIEFNGVKFSVSKDQFDKMMLGAGHPDKLPNPLESPLASPIGYTFEAVGYEDTAEKNAKFILTYDEVKAGDMNRLTFTIRRGTQTFSQSYQLENVIAGAKYVTDVTGITSIVTSDTLQFYVTTNESIDEAALADGWVVQEVLDVAGNIIQEVKYKSTADSSISPPNYFFKVTLVPGLNRIKIFPNIEDGVNPDANSKMYNVMYVNSPDVKVHNLVSGDRIGGDGGLNASNGFVLQGELVNITGSANKLQTKVTITNSKNPSGALYTAPAHITFDGYTPLGGVPENNNSFELVLLEVPSGTLPSNTTKLEPGANTIVIEVTDGTITTSTRLDIFYFASGAPSVTIGLDNASNTMMFPDAKFQEGLPGVYRTEARYAYITANFGPVGEVREVNIYNNGIIAARINFVSGVGSVIPGSTFEDIFPVNTTIEVDGSLYTVKTSIPFSLLDGENTFEIEAINNLGASRSNKITITRSTPPIKIVQPDLELEKVINSNYLEVLIEASSADAVRIGKTEATYLKLSLDELRERIENTPAAVLRDALSDTFFDKINNELRTDAVWGKAIYNPAYESELERMDQSKITNKRFKADVYLKPGKNKITYEIEQNGQKNKGEFEIFYAASPTEGAKYKQEFKSGKISVFDNKVTLQFPKNTWLVDRGTLNMMSGGYGDLPIFDQFVSDTYLQFGIVDRQSGKLNKIWNPLTQRFELEDFAEPYNTYMPLYITPPDRTGYAGQIYWIESAGDIRTVSSGLVPTNRATLTLAYDPSIRDDAQNLLSIYKFEDDLGKQPGWVEIGGVVDTKKKTITAPIDEFGYYTVMAKRGTYNDIYNHPWAAPYLTAMYAKGIMKPETSTRFGSDMLTTRGELATILVKVMDLPINAGPYLDPATKRNPINPTFVDVNPYLDPSNGFYSYEYIETAGRAGIIRGMGQGEFGPDGLLTREQAAVMIARAANYKLTSDIEKSKKSLAKTFADLDRMSDYSIPYVEATVKAGVMNGTVIEGTKMMSFNPQQYLTRAEVAAIAYRLMQNQKKLPK